MREEYRIQLVKDCVTAGIAWVIMAVVFAALVNAGVIGGIILGFMCAGIPFGWRWLSNIFTAISFYTIAIKFLLAIFLGWIALPVVIIKDVIAYKAAE